MIKNLRWLAGASLALASLGGCSRANADRAGSLQGVVEYDERHLGFELAGRVASIDVHEGDVAPAGKVLAALDDELGRSVRAAREGEAEALGAQASLMDAGPRTEDVSSMAARVRAARAAEKLIADNLARERQLAARNVTPQSMVDDLERQLERARAERQAVESSLQALRKGARPQERDSAAARARAAEAAVTLETERLERYRLTTPEAGTVLDVHVEVGEIVAAGAPVVTLADTRKPYADVFVPQAELEGIRMGSKATLSVDATSKRFSGRVEHVSRKTEFTPRYLFSDRERPNLVVRVRIRIDDPEQRLHAGVPTFVDIERGGK